MDLSSPIRIVSRDLGMGQADIRKLSGTKACLSRCRKDLNKSKSDYGYLSRCLCLSQIGILRQENLQCFVLSKSYAWHGMAWDVVVVMGSRCQVHVLWSCRHCIVYRIRNYTTHFSCNSSTMRQAKKFQRKAGHWGRGLRTVTARRWSG